MTWTSASIRELEGDSIRAFVESCSEHFTGSVLDLGCGKQPYREIVEAAGSGYVPWDRAALPANVSGEDIGLFECADRDWDTILCTQVAQYWTAPWLEPRIIRTMLKDGGVLVMTYATNWDWIEPDDKWRFTPSGMDAVLRASGFKVERSEERAAVELGGFRFPLGYGVVARAA